MKTKFLLALISASLLFTNACVTVSKDGKPVDTQKNTNAQTQMQKELSEALNEMKGEYAQLDYKRTDVIVKDIFAGDMTTIKSVLENPNNFEPPVLFAYADQVFKAGQPEIAMFWYYTAQLRARSDANKSFDRTVQDGVTNLSSNFGAEIGNYALENLDSLEKTMGKVVEWDASAQRNYNPKWVAILGNEAKIGDKIRFRDPSEYKKVDSATREGWKQGFASALKQLKEQSRRKKRNKED